MIDDDFDTLPDDLASEAYAAERTYWLMLADQAKEDEKRNSIPSEFPW